MHILPITVISLFSTGEFEIKLFYYFYIYIVSCKLKKHEKQSHLQHDHVLIQLYSIMCALQYKQENIDMKSLDVKANCYFFL